MNCPKCEDGVIIGSTDDEGNMYDVGCDNCGYDPS